MTIVKGIIDSVNPKLCTCNVKIPDQDDRIINDLQIVYPGTYGTQDYRMPKVGMTVVCIFDSNNETDGFVIGGVYNDEQIPPETNADISSTTYPDGSVISYDSNSKKFSMNLVGDAEIRGKSINIFGNLFINGKLWLQHQHSSGKLLDGNSKAVTGTTGDGQA